MSLPKLMVSFLPPNPFGDCTKLSQIVVATDFYLLLIPKYKLHEALPALHPAYLRSFIMFMFLLVRTLSTCGCLFFSLLCFGFFCNQVHLSCLLKASSNKKIHDETKPFFIEVVKGR